MSGRWHSGLYCRAIVYALLGVFVARAGAEARVVRFIVEQRRPFAEGQSWGTAGAYERLDGTAFFEIDPRDPLNAVVVNLDRAPKNARGLVEFSAPFYIVKPVDMARGNGKLFYGINNRGGQVEFSLRIAPGLPTTTGRDPVTADDVGDGLLFRMGFAYVDAGWQGDGRPGTPAIGGPKRIGNPLFPAFPAATESDGRPIIGKARLELRAGKETYTLPLISGFKPYAAATTNTSGASLTARAGIGDPRTTVDADRWAFGRCPTGVSSLVPSATDICLFEGFKPGQIYELIYPARDPVVMGLAYVVTRDVASFLRYRAADDAGNRNPLAMSETVVGIRHAYSSGSSSTGMYQREFLYLGFNEDESHRKVFDGVIVNMAGTHRLFANVPFTHPTFYSGQDQHHDYVSGAVAPFTFAITTDPVTGLRDGILKRPATDPMVMQLDGEVEMWQWRGSLNVADGNRRPVPNHPNVRLYVNSGFGHGSVTGLLAPSAPPGGCRNPQQMLNNTGANATLRALTVAMDEWVDRGISPPPSRYPRLDDGSLVTFEEFTRRFPQIPGVARPSGPNGLNVLDFGPGFGAHGGEQTVLPPGIGRAYSILVPRPDRDGVGLGGVRPMQIRVPLGSNLGWNVQAGKPSDLCTLAGSFIPFARTKAERAATKDSRPSLEERYRTHDGFIKAAEHAAQDLVRERLLLQEDADRFIQAARASDVLTAQAPAAAPNTNADQTGSR